MPPEISGVLPRENLAASQREEMFALLSRHFDGVTREQFERDLAEKNWVVEVRRERRLIGFSTLLVCESEVEGRLFTVIYSGDTIVAPEGWASPALARTWIAAVNQMRAGFPARPCYWLLLTSGFRTYRLLPVFWREFFPRYDMVTPRDAQRLLDHLASTRYGARYHARSGIVRFQRPQTLRGPLSAVPAGRASDSHIAFFLSKNPGHVAGDELACITEISDANLTRAGRRIVASTLR